MLINVFYFYQELFHALRDIVWRDDLRFGSELAEPCEELLTDFHFGIDGEMVITVFLILRAACAETFDNGIQKGQFKPYRDAFALAAKHVENALRVGFEIHVFEMLEPIDAFFKDFDILHTIDTVCTDIL